MSRQYRLWSIVAAAIMVFGTVAGFAMSALESPAHTSVGIPHEAANSVAAQLGKPSGGSAPLTVPYETQRLALQQSEMSAFHASDVKPVDFYPPNYMGGGVVKNGVVSPITLQSPAPMGIGDFGVNNETGTPVPTVLDTQSWESTINLNSANVMYLDSDGPDTFGGQLNTVVGNVTVWNTPGGVYWIQDVFFYEPSTGLFLMLDNIWNFTSVAGCEPASTFAAYGGYAGQGGTAACPGGTYYYDEIEVPVAVPMPFTLHMWTNSSITNFTAGQLPSSPKMEDPTVNFGYQLLVGGVNISGASNWDTVLFNSTETPTPVIFHMPLFQVNGAHLTPNNFLLYDAEMMLGGPGGGSTVSFNAINATMSLESYDATTHNFVNVPTAWDVGTDTGETAEGIAEHYTSQGTVILEGGPSLIYPLWGATPGKGAGGADGNIGTERLTGTLSPDNAFIFVTPGINTALENNSTAWAPTMPGGVYSYDLPPGNYSADVLMSEYDPATTIQWSNPTSHPLSITNDIALNPDQGTGIYTPLWAWNNWQLGNLSGGIGAGTPTDPYFISGYQYQLIWPQFGELNDYLFPVFTGIQIVDTTANAVFIGLPPMQMNYPSAYAGFLSRDGLPLDNELQWEFFDASGITIQDNTISGWESEFEFSPYLPTSEVILWNVEDSVVLDNVFQDQGIGLFLLNGDNAETPSAATGNTVYGNVFETGVITSTEYPWQTGVEDFEPGDLFVGNVFDVTAGAVSTNENFWIGGYQNNYDMWNLTAAVTATTTVVNPDSDIALTGNAAGLPWTCGNLWDNYDSYVEYQSAPPWNSNFTQVAFYGYNDYIQDGGDYCPAGFNATTLSFGMVTYNNIYTESGLTSGSWTITDGVQTVTAPAGSAIVIPDINGTWTYWVTAESGMTATPSTGTQVVNGAGSVTNIVFATPPPPVRPTYEVSVAETGLPAGTPWSILVNGTQTVSSTGASVISWTETDGSYTYSTNAVADYTISSGASGTLTVNGGAATATTVFTANSGTVSVTVTPATASVWIGGVAVTGTAGVFSSSAAPGVVSIEVTDWAAHDLPYFTNVTVSAGTTTSRTVTLAAEPTITTTVPGPTQYNNQTASASLTSSVGIEGIVIGLVIGLIVGLLVAMMMRKKSPPSGTGSGAPQWNAGQTGGGNMPPPPPTSPGAPPPRQ